MTRKVTRLPTAKRRPVKNGVAMLDGSEKNVIGLGKTSRLDLPPERVLNEASTRGLTDVVIIGFDADGDFYFAGSAADGGDVLWLLELAKKRLLELADS